MGIGGHCGWDGGRETPHPSASLTPSPQGEGFFRLRAGTEVTPHPALRATFPSRGRLTGRALKGKA